MENILNVIKDKRCNDGKINEKEWIALKVPSGKLIVSDYYNCFSNNIDAIDYDFDIDKEYKTFLGYTNNYVVYLRIEISDEEIFCLAGIDHKEITIEENDWPEYSIYDGNLNGECNFSILDSEENAQISKYIKKQYENNYSLLVKEIDPKIKKVGEFGLIEIDGHKLPFIHTPNSCAIAFVAMNRNMDAVSIIIEFGVCQD